MSAYTPDPAGWLAVVCDDRALVIGGEPSDEFVAAAWSVVRDDGGTAALLDLLTAQGLSATPPFALLERAADSTRLVVRGDVAVTAGDGETVSGAGLSTWTERTLDGRHPLRAVVTAAAGPQLPLVAGVVRVAALSLGADRTTGAVADEPATKVLPEAPGVDESTIITEATILEVPEAPPPPVATDAGAGGGYDYLFGATVMRPVKDAAVEAESAPSDEPAAEPAREGDHDGHTILATDLQRLREHSAQPGAAEAPGDAPAFTVRMPSGAREPITGTMIIGRAPSVSRVSGDRLPRLVTIADRDNDISRNHVQLSLEGDTVVVTDLHSKNGTVVVLPGRDPQKLRAGEPASVIGGTVVDLGAGIELQVEQT